MDLISYVPEVVVPPGKIQRAPVVEHRCEVPPRRNEFKYFLKNDGFFSRFCDWFMKFFILSVKHPYTRTCLKSTAAINYEINRHIKSYPYMIHPFSLFRIFWDLFTTIFTIIALFIVPVLLAYYFNNHEYWFPITLFIDIIFLSDMIVTFVTGYYDFETRIVILDPKIVANNYLKSYFFPELLTIIPVELIDVLINRRENTTWFSPIFNFIKIFRLRNVLSNSRNLKQAFQMSFEKYKIIEMALMIAMTIHWSACLEYYVPQAVVINKELHETNNSWIWSPSMKKRDSRIKKHILCLQRATTALVSSSHHLPVETLEDMILNLILLTLGKLGFIYLLAQFFQISTAFRSLNKQDIKFLQQLREFMHYKELPSETQKRLLVYCDYYNKKHFERQQYIISQVTPHLRQELILHKFKELLETVSLFKYLPQPVIPKLAECIRPKIYLANDEIVKINTPGSALFYIVSGTVAIYSNKGKEICHLDDGCYFGDFALVMENETRIASVIAIETCLLYTLIRSDFIQAISGYPSLLNRLQKVALKRLELMLLPGEASKERISLPQSVNISNI